MPEGPDLVQIDSDNESRGKFRKKGGAANAGGDGLSHGLLAPSVFQSCNALNGDVEARGEVMYPFAWQWGTSVLLKKTSKICPGADS